MPLAPARRGYYSLYEVISIRCERGEPHSTGHSDYDIFFGHQSLHEACIFDEPDGSHIQMVTRFMISFSDHTDEFRILLTFRKAYSSIIRYTHIQSISKWKG